MLRSVKELLTDVLDYSGIKSPDQDGLRDALINFLNVSKSKHSWMQSRFVIPHFLLPELSQFSDRKNELTGPLNLSVSGPETENLEEFTNVVNSIKKDILSVHADYPGEVRSSLLELKFPVGSVEELNPKDLVRALERVVLSAADSRLLPHRVFFEIPGDELNAVLTKKIIKVIAVHNKSILKRKIENYLFSGLKVNCGSKVGSPAQAEYLAEIMLYARDANVAVKFNGDDNQFFTGYNESELEVFGFINILMAAMLAYTQDLNAQEIMEVLKDKKVENFMFQDNYLAWRELAAPSLEVKMLRMLSIISFTTNNYENLLGGFEKLEIS